ncbi:hypothetical protein D9615_002882 [Tricholomella constricta]|uniref:HPt domain-containing protein n=1 Tax=Tricholomella constricta TaxID=117010 RepID=A0A8H5HG65_9AGAR|nr:hypothetical protein D9615_002882 [Tricholomella constricta]
MPEPTAPAPPKQPTPPAPPLIAPKFVDKSTPPPSPPPPPPKSPPTPKSPPAPKPTTPDPKPDPKPDPTPDPSPSHVRSSITPRCPPLIHKAPPQPSPDLDIVDMDTFQQILDLDEDATHEFSKGMAWAYFTQAAQTFKEMDEALVGKDLAQLSSLGHFLKGSSAALGLFKVQASCEKIQHYGQQRDEEAGKNLSVDGALAKIETLLSQVNKEYTAAETWLKNWYDEHAEPEPDSPDLERS